jgi:hypothetical protein
MRRAGPAADRASHRCRLSGLSPYLRVAATKEFDVVAFDADVRPDPAIDTKDKYRDWGLDASWQYLGTHQESAQHPISVQGARVPAKIER